jgi:hypothetical protein
MPAIWAFWEALPESKPNTQGEKNRIAPRIRFATSHNFAFVQFSMTPSNFEGFPVPFNWNMAARVPHHVDNI